MTSKERAKLKSAAANTETILQIGKNPIGDTIIKQIDDALSARELIKIRVLETCEMLPLEAAQAICEEVRCETVQVIGSRIVLFRRRPGDDKKPSLLDEPKPEKKSATEGRADKNAAYNKSGRDGSKNKFGKGASGQERKPQKNEQYRSGTGKKGRSGADHGSQKNGKKSGNFRRGF